MSDDLQRTFAYRLPLNRVPWFDVLVSSGRLDEWLRSEKFSDFQYGVTVMEQPAILTRRGDQVAERVRALLDSPHLPAERKRRVLHMFSFDWFHGNEALFTIFLAALRRGDFEAASQDWGMRFYQLPERYPERAVKVLEAVFDLANQTPSPKGPDFSRFRFPEGFVSLAASRVPEAFARAFLPRLVSLMIQHRQVIQGIGVTDTVWPVLMFGIEHDLKWILLDRLADSLAALADKNPATLDSLTTNLEDSDIPNVGYLLLSAWTGKSQQYADRIIKYLLRHHAFLELGYASWGEGNGHAAIARAAIAGATKYSEEANLRELESVILDYYPAFEKEQPKRFGYIQALLLHAIDQTRISSQARARMEQLDRKFPNLDLSPPKSSGGFSLVESPIPEQAVSKMTDDNWLAAMARYHGGNDDDPTQWLTGGVHQLSGQLEVATRRDKVRFAKLALKMGADLAPAYFDAILRGLTATKDEQNRNAPLPALDSQILFAVFLHVHNLPDRPSGQWLTSSISAMASRDLPSEILEIVVYYAMHGQTPEGSGGLTGRSFGANLVNHGINTIRGAAADCLGSLLFRDPKRWPFLEKAVLHVVHDDSWAVRAVSISCLTALLNIDRNRAVSLFVEIADQNDALWGSMFVSRFLLFASQTHFTVLRDIVHRMLAASDGDVAETAAQVIAVSSFRLNEAMEDLALVRAGPEHVRAAWIQVAAENLRVPEVSARCRDWLKEGFFDKSSKVRDVAGRCFHNLSSDQLCAEIGLINSFLESPAFEDAATFLLMALEQAVDRLPDVIWRIPEKAVAIYRARTDQDKRPWWVSEMSTLVLRLYNQTRDPAIRSHCLDAIDNMIELGFGEVAVELEKIERT